MTEKTILITGATGGIGLALCERLTAARSRLVLAARSREKLEALADRLAQQEGSSRAIVLPVDMADDASVHEFARELAAREVLLDGVVVMPPQPPHSPETLPDNDTWRTLLQASFLGPLSLLKAAIAAMQPRPEQGRRCKIVIVSGISSVQVLSHSGIGHVIRAAWLAQAKTLAIALGERGIHVNTLSLGGTLSPHYVEQIGKRAARAGVTYEQQLATETANIPLRKYARPGEVAAVIEGLLSEMSDHLTGINLLHDGGFTRSY